MTTTQFVTATWLKAEGENPSFVPGSEEWNYVVGLGNFYIDEWAHKLGGDWKSLYDPAYQIGSVTATDTFEFDNTEVRKFSNEYGDTVRIIHANGTDYTDYTLVPADELKQNNSLSVVARLGTSLRFPSAFDTTKAQFGGTLYAPVYLFPSKLVGANDEVPVDDPNWLVQRTAADVALHDILRKDTSPILQAEADASMAGMMTENEAQLNRMGTPWTPPSGPYSYSGNYNGYGEI